MPYSQSLKNLTHIMPEDLIDHVLLFIAGDFLFAMPLIKITSVLRMFELTPVSECRDSVNEHSLPEYDLKAADGCISYQGIRTPVFSLIGFFGKNKGELSPADNLIIINTGIESNKKFCALRVKKIIGIYGRKDIFESEKNDSKKNNKSESSAEDNSANENFLRVNIKNFESIGLKLYHDDSESGIVAMIEDPFRFLLNSRYENLKDILPDAASKINKEYLSADYESENFAGSAAKGELSDETLRDSVSKDYLNKYPNRRDLTEFKHIEDILKERKKETTLPEIDGWEDEKTDILRFRLMYREYAIVMKYIREVLIYDRLTPVPGTPEYISGIFALRGEIISLVDLRKYFSLPRTGITDLNLVIVLTDGNITFGILADYITDIGRIKINQLKNPKEQYFGIDSRFIKGIADEKIIVLDAEALLANPDMIIDDK